MTSLRKKSSRTVNTSFNRARAETSFTLFWRAIWLPRRRRLKMSSQEWFTSTSKATTLESWLCSTTFADKPVSRLYTDAEWPQSTETVSRECWAASKTSWKEMKKDTTTSNKRLPALDFLCYYFDLKLLFAFLKILLSFVLFFLMVFLFELNFIFIWSLLTNPLIYIRKIKNVKNLNFFSRTMLLPFDI